MYVCTITALTGKLDVVSMAKLLLAIKYHNKSAYLMLCQKGRTAMILPQNCYSGTSEERTHWDQLFCPLWRSCQHISKRKKSNDSSLALIYTWNVFKALYSLTSNKGQLLSTKDKTAGPKCVLSSEVPLQQFCGRIIAFLPCWQLLHKGQNSWSRICPFFGSSTVAVLWKNYCFSSFLKCADNFSTKDKIAGSKRVLSSEVPL